MLLGDDIMVDDAALLTLDARGARPRAGVGARAARGDAGRDRVARLRGRRPRGRLARARAFDRREAEARGGAVEPRGDRSLRVHAARSSTRSTGSRRAWEASSQLTDAIGLLLDDAPVYGRIFTEGRYDIGKPMGFLQANIELALERDDLGPELGEYLRAAGEGARPHMITPEEVRDADPRRRRTASTGRRRAARRAAASCSPTTSCRATRCRRSRTPRWTATRCGPPTPPAPPTTRRWRSRVVGTLAAGAAPTVAVSEGTALRIMTGAPMPDGADAIVMVELTAPDDDDRVRILHAAAVGDHVRARGR